MSLECWLEDRQYCQISASNSLSFARSACQSWCIESGRQQHPWTLKQPELPRPWAPWGVLGVPAKLTWRPTTCQNISSIDAIVGENSASKVAAPRSCGNRTQLHFDGRNSLVVAPNLLCELSLESWLDDLQSCQISALMSLSFARSFPSKLVYRIWLAADLVLQIAL